MYREGNRERKGGRKKEGERQEIEIETEKGE
jgi:hypothetical protein